MRGTVGTVTKETVRSVMVALVAGGFVIGPLATSSAADEGPRILGDNSVWAETPGIFPGGSAKFYHRGDKVKVCDTSADGAKAVARLRYANSGRLVGQVSVGGNDRCNVKSFSGLNEGTSVALQVHLLDGGNRFDYSDSVTGTA